MNKIKIEITILINMFWLLCLFGLYFLTFGLRVDLVGLAFLITALQLITFLSVVAVKNVSLILIYFIFSLVFLNLLPWLHYTEDIFIWRAYPLREQTYLEVNALLFVSNAIVFLFAVSFGKTGGAKELIRRPSLNQGSMPGYILLATSLLGLFSLLAINGFSITPLLFRGLVDEVRGTVIESSAINLLVTMLGRMIPFFCFVYAVTSIEKKLVLKTILFLILLAAVFPTGVPRFLLGFVYIPLALIFFPRFRNGLFFTLLLISAIIIVFPFIDQFREFSGVDNLSAIASLNYFLSAHFDAFENMATAIESEIVTNGFQLLGVMLFYVPRVLWEAKPIGSGQMMAEDHGYLFTNISMPFLGEGYINFGYVGFFVFAILIGYVMTRIDRHFAGRMNSNGMVDFSTAFYFYLIGCAFYVMRGDLLSSAAYLSSGIFVAAVLSTVTRALKRDRSN